MEHEYTVVLTDQAKKTVAHLKKRDVKRAQRVARALKKLRDPGPQYPGLKTHKIESIKGPYGETWESYVENNTPSAWRVFWCYGPRDRTITVFSICPHPD